MTGDKFRFRFAKAGTLRLLSHHDLMRCLERMLRRADLPFASTGGFHPTPRLVFALSLPLGVVGRDEVMELELTRPFDSDDVLTRLRAQAPAGLTFLSAAVVPKKATATPRRVVYTLPLPAERVAETTARAAELLAQAAVWVERLKPSPKRLNIRPYLRSIIVTSGGLTPPESADSRLGSSDSHHLERVTSYPPPVPARWDGLPLKGGGKEEEPTKGLFTSPLEGEVADQRSAGGGYAADQADVVALPGLVPARLELDLWVTQTGTARGDELVRLLGLDDLLDAGAVLERSRVEIRDEVTAGDPADGPPDGPADTRPLRGPAVHAAAVPGDESQGAEADWGASPGGPVPE